MLFFVFFSIFGLFSVAFPPPGNFSADALATNYIQFTSLSRI